MTIIRRVQLRVSFNQKIVVIFQKCVGEYSIPIQHLPLDKETCERLANSVNKIRGFGARKLTEQEIGNDYFKA